MNVSVIVPTWNRSHLLQELLVSLCEERKRFEGEIEIVVVDSSDGEEERQIRHFCIEHGADYHRGEQSVRKKRNLGVSKSKHELLLFLDSDVVAMPGIVAAHVSAYNNRNDIGAVQGLTKFVGPDTFLWNCTKHSKLIWSFTNAERFPYQSWSITNNLSVRRSVFDEIGGFCEDFPFKLGGDDLEMSYRINKYGYLIASAPSAVAEHSKETWNKVGAIYDRTKRWGTMESFICDRHPELYRYAIPKNYLFELMMVLVLFAATLIKQTLEPLALAGLFLLVFGTQRWIRDMKANGAFIWPHSLLFGCLINAFYEFFRIKGHVERGHKSPLLHGFVFNAMQVRGTFYEDSPRLVMMLVDYLAMIVACVVVFHG